MSSHCSLEVVSCGAIEVLLDLVTQMNRSTAALLLVKTIVQILLNISKVRVICYLSISCFNIKFHLQWELTQSSVFQSKGSLTVVVDLIYKVYGTQPELLLLALKLLLIHSTTKVNVLVNCTFSVRLHNYRY